MNHRPVPSRLRRKGFLQTLVRGVARSVLALWAVPAILCGKNLPAQILAPQARRTAQQQEAAARPTLPSRHYAAHVHAASTEGGLVPKTVPEPPPAPPVPNWPANQPPRRAKVSWDSHGLEIEAFNSSLFQILHQVAADTGAKFQGLTQDQRIFGTYGPAPARDVLGKLLDDSDYNVLMIGGRDADAPLEVVLSVSPPASPQTDANNRKRSNSEDDEADPPPEPPRPPPMETPFGNGDSRKRETPLQIMQGILDRQHKIDQRVQQGQEQQNNAQQ